MEPEKSKMYQTKSNEKVDIVQQLSKAPEHSTHHYEIATQYNSQLPELWNSLTAEERIFAYYMMRASIPGNTIAADQTHRHAVEIITIFYTIVTNKECIYDFCNDHMDVKQFLQEAELFLVYLFAHH